MEMIFKVCLIIADAIVLTVTDSKISKIFGVLAIILLSISFLGRQKMGMIKRWIAYLKRPKCPNNYRCPDCIHSDMHWEGIKFRGFSCRINAR